MTNSCIYQDTSAFDGGLVVRCLGVAGHFILTAGIDPRHKSSWLWHFTHHQWGKWLNWFIGWLTEGMTNDSSYGFIVKYWNSPLSTSLPLRHSGISALWMVLMDKLCDTSFIRTHPPTLLVAGVILKYRPPSALAVPLASSSILQMRVLFWLALADLNQRDGLFLL